METAVIRRTFLLAVTAAALSAPLLAQAQAQPQAIELAGVRYEPTAQVGNTRLVLNGAGIRYKAIFKVYTAGLYLTAKATTPEAVLATPGPRRMHITMLRDIDANELGKLFTRGMEQNTTRDDFMKSIAGTLKLSEVFSAKKKLVAGDSFFVDWTPGQGTVIVVNGKPANEPIKEPEFYSSLLKIWLGHSPADSALKDALLGKQATGNGAGAGNN
jgi:hypothetical protein